MKNRIKLKHNDKFIVLEINKKNIKFKTNFFEVLPEPYRLDCGSDGLMEVNNEHNLDKDKMKEFFNNLSQEIISKFAEEIKEK